MDLIKTLLSLMVLQTLISSYFIKQIINDTLSRNLTRSIFITSDSHKWNNGQYEANVGLDMIKI